MTIRNKQALIAEIVALLDKSIDTEVPDTPISKPTNDPTEMLRIKDCTKAFPGLSEYTVRKLVANKKIPYNTIYKVGRRGEWKDSRLQAGTGRVSDKQKERLSMSIIFRDIKLRFPHYTNFMHK